MWSVAARFAVFAGAAAVGAAAAAQLTASDPVHIEGAAERQSLTSLLTEALATLRSPRFQANLKSLQQDYPLIYLRQDPGGAHAAGTVDDLAGIVAGKAPKYHYVRSPVALTGGHSDSTVFVTKVGARDGSMTLGREHLVRWQAADLVDRSCAVNTVAHEISHLVSTSPTSFDHALTDTLAAAASSVAKDGSPLASPLPVGSYLVGTVAQCTWLQENGYSPAVDLRTCVQMFGTRGFNKNRCKEFSGGRAIKFRTGLPLPHVLN